MAPTLFQIDFSNVFSLDFLVVIFAFLFVDVFDTLGTLIGVASKADMLDEEGKLPRIKAPCWLTLSQPAPVLCWVLPPPPPMLKVLPALPRAAAPV